ncbi:MAG: hypothetical protein JXB47_12985 [Anaerolineae bacterium]|nr:hypothetical protein [Anaerolineae bacterium]
MPTAFEELSKCLEQAEEWSARLPQADAQQILEVITGLDGAQHWVDRLVANDARRPAEEIQRIETIESFLRKNVRLAVNRLEGAGVSLAQVAGARAYKPDAWWWHLPELRRQQQQQALRQLASSVGIGAVVIVIAIILLQTVFAPDPAVVARVNAVEAAQLAILEQDDPEAALHAIDGGLTEIERILAERGEASDSFNTVELLTWRGVILQELGHDAEAGAEFAKAEAQDAWEMYANRAMAYRYLGKPEAALPDAQKLVELKPEHPASHLLLGDVYRDLNDSFAADEAYQKAEELAFASDEFANIYVLARQRRADLMGMPLQ